MHPCSQVTDCVKYLSRHTYIVSVSVSQSSNVQITFGAEALRMQHEDLNMFVSVFSLHTPVTRGFVWWWGRPSRCTSGWQERRGGRCTSQLRRGAFSKVHNTIALFKVHSTIAVSKIHPTVHNLGQDTSECSWIMCKMGWRGRRWLCVWYNVQSMRCAKMHKVDDRRDGAQMLWTLESYLS